MLESAIENKKMWTASHEKTLFHYVALMGTFGSNEHVHDYVESFSKTKTLGFNENFAMSIPTCFHACCMQAVSGGVGGKL